MLEATTNGSAAIDAEAGRLEPHAGEARKQLHTVSFKVHPGALKAPIECPAGNGRPRDRSPRTTGEVRRRRDPRRREGQDSPHAGGTAWWGRPRERWYQHRQKLHSTGPLRRLRGTQRPSTGGSSISPRRLEEVGAVVASPHLRLSGPRTSQHGVVVPTDDQRDGHRAAGDRQPFMVCDLGTTGPRRFRPDPSSALFSPLIGP